MGQPRGTFVGRQRDLDELGERLAAAAAGRGSLLLVAGEPGIGKTRLADELARGAARSLGAGVLWGTCWEGEGAPAFWPWIQALRAHAARRDPAALRAELGDAAFDRMRTAHFEMLRKAIATHGGTPVKNTGDAANR